MASSPSSPSGASVPPSGASSVAPSVAASSVVGNTLPVTPAIQSAPSSPVKKKVRKPATVAETITAGKTLRVQKSSMPKTPARLPPKPTIPRGMLPTDRDVKMRRRDKIRQARCLRKHNIVLSDRMDELSKPTQRQLIALWRNYADILTPEQINNLQNQLDAADPFKPDQAYEYFINLRKQRRRAIEKETGGKGKKKELSALCGDRQFAWVRCATVAFARGIQRRLGRPGTFELEGGMLRLSDIVLDEICSYSKMKPPSRSSKQPRAKFMCEMADKIAVWIDEILAESDDHLLMMDFDEDNEVEEAKKGPGPSAGSKPTDSSASPTASTTSATTPGTATPPAAASGTVASTTSLKSSPTPGTATPATPATPGTATPAAASPTVASPTVASTTSLKSSAAPGTATPATPATPGTATPATPATPSTATPKAPSPPPTKPKK